MWSQNGAVELISRASPYSQTVPVKLIIWEIVVVKLIHCIGVKQVSLLHAIKVNSHLTNLPSEISVISVKSGQMTRLK